MKLLSRILSVLVCGMSYLIVCGSHVILKLRLDKNPPRPKVEKHIPIRVTIQNPQLIISLTKTKSCARIDIFNDANKLMNQMVLHGETEDTGVVSLVDWKSGKYIILVTYDNTTFCGDFTL
jgi:hypothetical protein